MTRRWTLAERRAINRALARGRFPGDLPTVIHDGRSYVDLRGFPFESGIQTGISYVDFSDANLEQGGIMVPKATVANCLFRGARLWTTLGYDLRRCDFHKAQMKGAELRGVFRDCSFDDANLVGLRAGTPGTKFVRCSFRDCRFRNAAFRDVSFRDCSWDGATFGDAGMADCTFVNGRPTDAQLGDTLMESDIDEATERELTALAEARTRREMKLYGRRPRRKR